MAHSEATTMYRLFHDEAEITVVLEVWSKLLIRACRVSEKKVNKVSYGWHLHSQHVRHEHKVNSPPTGPHSPVQKQMIFFNDDKE